MYSVIIEDYKPCIQYYRYMYCVIIEKKYKQCSQYYKYSVIREQSWQKEKHAKLGSITSSEWIAINKVIKLAGFDNS